MGVGPHGSNVAAAVRPEVTAPGAPTKVADAASAAIESTGDIVPMAILSTSIESDMGATWARSMEACGDMGAASMPSSSPSSSQARPAGLLPERLEAAGRDL